MDAINNFSCLKSYVSNLQNTQKIGDLALNKTDTTQKSFSTYLNNAVANLNQNMTVMDNGTTGLVTGTNNDLGKVMINMTEAQLTLQTAVQVRNKVLDAYNDIKNMQF